MYNVKGLQNAGALSLGSTGLGSTGLGSTRQVFQKPINTQKINPLQPLKPLRPSTTVPYVKTDNTRKSTRVQVPLLKAKGAFASIEVPRESCQPFTCSYI